MLLVDVASSNVNFECDILFTFICFHVVKPRLILNIAFHIIGFAYVGLSPKPSSLSGSVE